MQRRLHLGTGAWVIAGLLACGAADAHAAAVVAAPPVNWTDWTLQTQGNAGSASGTLTDSSGAITVSYSGDVANTTSLGGGFNYWQSPSDPYVSATVPNAPTESDIITIDTANGGALNTITFSQAVLNPLMAIVSQGTPSRTVNYTFDTPFDVVSYGNGYWNFATGFFVSAGAGLFEQSGNVLVGREGHGVIQFQGLVSSISWSTSPNEYWHGFTIGVIDGNIPEPVPEPASLALLGLGALAAARRLTA